MSYYIGFADTDKEILGEIDRKFHNINVNPFILENHKDLATLLATVDRKIKVKDYGVINQFQKTVSKRTTFQLETDFLSSLCSKYKNEFIKSWIGRKFVQVDPKVVGQHYRNFSRRKYKIYCNIDNEEFNLKDLTTICHEYIHHLSSKFPKILKDTFSYGVHCETLSTLGELDFLDFLLENGFSNKEVEMYKKWKMIDHKKEIYPFLTIEPLFNIYLLKGKLTMSDIDELLNTNSFYKDVGKQDIFLNLKQLVSENLEDWLLPSHIYGLIVASKLHQDGISNEDFVQLIETINVVELDEFERMLPKKSDAEYIAAIQKEFGFSKVKKL